MPTLFITFSKEQAILVSMAANTTNIMNIISISTPPTRWLHGRHSGSSHSKHFLEDHTGVQGPAEAALSLLLAEIT